MVAWLDAKLSTNGLAQQAIKDKDARTLFVCAAESCVGVREKTGSNDGPMVELIQETVGRAEGEPWCMSFVQTCLAYAELKTGVKSPVVASEHVMTTWRETPATSRVRLAPKRGAIVCWRHGASDRGHTGIVLEPDRSYFTAVEGNTGNGIEGGEVVREGDGVYKTSRRKSGTGNMRVVGFLKPF